MCHNSSRVKKRTVAKKKKAFVCMCGGGVVPQVQDILNHSGFSVLSMWRKVPRQRQSSLTRVELTKFSDYFGTMVDARTGFMAFVACRKAQEKKKSCNLVVKYWLISFRTTVWTSKCFNSQSSEDNWLSIGAKSSVRCEQCCWCFPSPAKMSPSQSGLLLCWLRV